MNKAYILPDPANSTIMANDGHGGGVPWYSPSTGIVVSKEPLTRDQLESMTRLSSINWSQIIKDIETILAMSPRYVPPPASTPKEPPKNPFAGLATKLGSLLLAASLTAGTVSYAGGQSGQAPPRPGWPRPRRPSCPPRLCSTSRHPRKPTVDALTEILTSDAAVTDRIKAITLKASKLRATPQPAVSTSARAAWERQHALLDAAVTALEAEFSAP